MGQFRQLPKRQRRTRQAELVVKEIELMPKKVPPEHPFLKSSLYQPIYDMMLKHSAYRGTLTGNFVEVGPWQGEFMNFLLGSSAAKNSKLFISGFEPLARGSKKSYYDPTLATHIRPMSIERIKKYPNAKGIADVVVVKNVFDSPRVVNNSKKISAMFDGISYITKPKGKAYIQTAEPEQNISGKLIKQQGWKVIDVMNKPLHKIFILVLKKIK